MQKIKHSLVCQKTNTVACVGMTGKLPIKFRCTQHLGNSVESLLLGFNPV